MHSHSNRVHGADHRQATAPRHLPHATVLHLPCTHNLCTHNLCTHNLCTQRSEQPRPSHVLLLTPLPMPLLMLLLMLLGEDTV